MGIKKILNLFSKSSDKINENSKVIHANTIKMKTHRNQKTSADKDDWANTSGLYRKLSVPQKKYVDKISKILDQEDLDNF